MFNLIKNNLILKQENKRLKEELSEERRIDRDSTFGYMKEISQLEERERLVIKEMKRLNYDKRDLEKEIEELKKQLSNAIAVSRKWGQDYADVVFNKCQLSSMGRKVESNDFESIITDEIQQGFNNSKKIHDIQNNLLEQIRYKETILELKRKIEKQKVVLEQNQKDTYNREDFKKDLEISIKKVKQYKSEPEMSTEELIKNANEILNDIDVYR